MRTQNHDAANNRLEANKHEACSRCGKPITGQDKFCANCGHARAVPRAWYASEGLVITAAIGLVILIAVVMGTNSDKTITAPHKFEPSTLLPGATLQLRSDGGAEVPVVPTRDLYKEWMRLAEAKDTVGEQTMINEGQMLMTPSGTRARLLESHDLWDGSYNIRILDGPLFGQAVWTSSVFVSEDKAEETKKRPPSPEHQSEGKAGDLTVGDKAIIYGSVVVETDENAYEELMNLLGTSDYVGKYEELARDGRVLNCARGSGSDINRMSVIILDANSAAGGNVYVKIQITGVLKGQQDAVMRAAGFADEDRNGSPEDCFFLDGQPPNVGYRHVNSVGSIGYIDKDRLFPVDAEGHDFRFKNLKSDINQLLDQVDKGKQGLTPSPTGPIKVPSPGVSMPIAGKENPKNEPKYVWIPPGTFQMGCSVGSYDNRNIDALTNRCLSDEEPAHQVSITKGFWLGQTEVTVWAYKRFAVGAGKDMPSDPDFNQGWSNDQMPIVNVSWNDAQAYCAWAGGRLPTEAEWEYAARAGSIYALYGPLDEIAWYGANSGGGTQPVGEKRANGFGLYDMLGNVCEWVDDWYDENYYRNSPFQDPAGPASGTRRVQRGGSWGYDTRNVRASFRYSSAPGESHPGAGFRCAREVGIP